MNASKYDGRGWPNYILRGRVRTSTAGLVVAFIVLFGVHQAFQPPAATQPAPQMVPPGYLPDPNYTWVPRTNVREQPTTTPTRTTPTTTRTTTAPPTTPTSPGEASTSPASPTSSAPDQPANSTPTTGASATPGLPAWLPSLPLPK